MIADVTIICVAFGTKYSRFVDGWWQSIQNLEVKPKDIIVVNNPSDETGIKDLPVTRISNDSNDLTKMLNIGFESVGTTWIGVLSLDDRYFPDALNDLQYAENNFDIIGVNAESMSTGKFLSSSLENLNSKNNHMLGSSFFTNEVYHRVGGWPEIFWSDWGFWWRCLQAHARFCNPPRKHLLIDDLSLDRISSSTNQAADDEIQKFIKIEV